MDIYCINPIRGGSGFRVHVVGQAGGLRVIGIFHSEADAEAWIAADRHRSMRGHGPAGCDLALRA
jgi:hypothetical protein